MLLWFDKNGVLKEMLTYGAPARVGTTNFKIFAYFEGLDTSVYGSAVIRFERPDMQGSEYPTLFMKKVDVTYDPQIASSSYFTLGGGPNVDGTYPCYMFDFNNVFDSENPDNRLILLDTPGLWKTSIVLINSNSYTKNVLGRISFNVEGSVSEEDDDPTELTYSVIAANIASAIATKLNMDSGYYIRDHNNLFQASTAGTLPEAVFVAGSYVFDKETNAIYVINAVESGAGEGQVRITNYTKIIDFDNTECWKRFLGTTEQRLAAEKDQYTIYADTTTGLDYIWNGSSFIALGEHSDLAFNADEGTNHINSIYYKEKTYYPTKLVSFEYIASNEKAIPISALISLDLPYNTNYLYYNTYNKQLYYYVSGSASLMLIGALQNLFSLTWDTDGYVITNNQRVTILNTIQSKATNFIIFEFNGGDYDGRRYLMNYHNATSSSYNLVCVDFEIDTETGKVSQFEKFKITISTTLGSVKGTWTEVASDNVSAVDSDTFIIGDTTYNIPSDVSDLENDAGYLTASSSTITTMQNAISGKQDALPSTEGNYDKFLHTNAITGILEWSRLSVPTGAFTYIGTTTTQLSDGSTTNPITIGGESVTATNGNVVFYGDAEFVWTGSAWEELGNKNQATSSVLGNIKLGNDTTIDNTASKVYPIQLNSSGQAFVYVPWTDNNTTYDIATGSVAGLVKSSTTGTTANRDYVVQVNNDGTMKVNVPWVNTTYASESAAQGGTTVSLVTTGEKYIWNNKQDALTTTSVSSGTLDEAIGFDSNGNLVRGTVSGGGGTDNIQIVSSLPSTSDAQNNILYKLNNDLYALTETEQVAGALSYDSSTNTLTAIVDYDANYIDVYDSSDTLLFTITLS